MENKISGIFKRGSTRIKVDELLSKKSKIEWELAKIRKSCTHTNQSIKMINNGGVSSFQVRWVCDECNSPIGWPTEEEEAKLNKIIIC